MSVHDLKHRLNHDWSLTVTWSHPYVARGLCNHLIEVVLLHKLLAQFEIFLKVTSKKLSTTENKNVDILMRNGITKPTSPEEPLHLTNQQ